MRNPARLASTERSDALLSEIERYLEAIALFRELGHEPRWRPETTSGLVLRVREWLEPRESHMSSV
jgi:hypothetical protein